MREETAGQELADKGSAGKAKPVYKRPLFWLIAVTGIWCTIVLAIVMKREQCGDPDVPIFFEGLLGLHRYYLACRSLNEFGDFLAGVFAPLALIWVAGAVYIQSQELAAQRTELELAREDARQTREVMKEQAAESRASREYISEQTAILRKEQTQREQEKADRDFDRLLVQMMAGMNWLPRLPGTYIGTNGRPVNWGEAEAEGQWTREPVSFFKELHWATDMALLELDNNPEIRVVSFKDDPWGDMDTYLAHMNTLEEHLSASNRSYFDTFKVARLRENLAHVQGKLRGNLDRKKAAMGEPRRPS